MILALFSFHFPIQDKFLVAISAASIQNPAYLLSDEKCSYLTKRRNYISNENFQQTGRSSE
jgi:hypothetical protein